MGPASEKLLPEAFSPRDSPDSPPYLKIKSRIDTNLITTKRSFGDVATEENNEVNKYKSV